MGEIVKDCVCDVMVMEPERLSFEDHYTHKCTNCGGGVTHEKNDSYNRYWGFSGYDEVPDQEERDSDD